MEKYGFFNIIISFCNSIVGSFPMIALPVESMTVFNDVGDYISVIAHYVPLTTFLSCLSIFFGIWLIYALISAVLQLL